MRLIDAPIGLFEHDGVISLKTEYSTEHRCGDGSVVATPDCYTVIGGEYFWGGATNVHNRNNLDVTPISDAAPVAHGRWIKHEGYTECSKCEYWYDSPESEDVGDRSRYCPDCGARMDLPERPATNTNK